MIDEETALTSPVSPIQKPLRATKPYWIVLCSEDIILRIDSMAEAEKIAHDAAKEHNKTMLIFSLDGGYEIRGTPEKIKLAEFA